MSYNERVAAEQEAGLQGREEMSSPKRGDPMAHLSDEG